MFLHAEIKGTAGYCSSKRKRSTLVSKDLGMRSRLTEFVTFLKFRRFLEVTHFYRSERLQSIVMVMLLMLVVAVTVVTMLLAMLKAMLEGAKSAQGHSAVQCTVPAWVGWGSCSCCLRNLGFAVSASERTFILKMACS